MKLLLLRILWPVKHANVMRVRKNMGIDEDLINKYGEEGARHKFAIQLADVYLREWCRRKLL